MLGPYQARWEQIRSGEWYAFVQNMGPNGTFKYEHPYDPNFWSDKSGTDLDHAPGFGGWACRHGHWAGDCKLGCGMPKALPPVSEEEVQETSEKLVALLRSMENSNTQ